VQNDALMIPIPEEEEARSPKRLAVVSANQQVVASPSQILADLSFQNELRSLVNQTVGSAVKTSLAGLITDSLREQLAPLTAQMTKQHADMTAYQEAQKTEVDLIRQQAEQTAKGLEELRALVQTGASKSAGTDGASSSRAADISAGSTSRSGIWVARPGVAFVGGFDKDTHREVIVSIIREVTAKYPRSADILSVWAPDKRWSNGRIQFVSDSALYAFTEWLSSHPMERVVTRGNRRIEIWAAKEKSIGKKQVDGVTSAAAKIFRGYVETQPGFDPAQLDVLYTGQAVWYGNLKALEFDKKAKRWMVAADMHSIGLDASMLVSMQRELDELVRNS
jgi:hypothetical protein